MKRWTPLLLALLLLLAFVACDEADEETDPEDLAEPPQIYLLTDDGQLSSFAENYCWNTQADTPADFDTATEMCGETEQPNFADATYTPVAVTATSPLRVELEEPLPQRVTLALSPPDDIFALATTDNNDPQDTVIEWVPEGLGSGDYILVVLAYWGEAGGAVYYYPVTLQ